MIKGCNIIISLVIACALFACDTESVDSYDGRVDVVLPISGGTSTRTTIDPDDLSSVRWSVGDQVALWADGESNTSSNLVGEMFQLKSYTATFDTANFSGSIYTMSEDQKYEYHAFYPYTTSYSGKKVSYTYPSTQGGKYDGTLDFRVANGTTGEALTDTTFDSDLSLEFNSVAHLLKVTIPYGYNKLGVPISQLSITMPEGYNCVGTFSVDLTDDDRTPSYVSNGSNSILLNFGDETIDEGDSVWVFINPTSTPVTGDIVIYGLGADHEQSLNYTIPLTDHTFAAGRITPVNTEIGEEKTVTTLIVTVTDAKDNIGEDLSSVNLTAPSGAIFEESGSNVYEIPYNSDNVYRATYVTALYGDKFKSSPVSVVLESPQTLNTMTSIDLSASSTIDDGVNYYSYVAPYVLYENFSEISYFHQENKPLFKTYDVFYPTVGSTYSVADDPGYVDFSDYGLTAENWTGTRCGGDNGAVGICGREEVAAGIESTYPARINSPALSSLKDGAKVKVTYKFKTQQYMQSYYMMPIVGYSWVDYKGATLYYQRGYYSDASNTSNPDADDNIAYSVDEDGVASSTSGSSITPTTAWSSSLSFTSISTDGEYEITDASSSTRLAWRVWGGNYDLGTLYNANGNFWLLIDEVVVQVVPQDE